ncbi:hypothetical protein MUK42_05226 [Musa troglodytarum]|uniref:Uncharacterized protein n=1 Tax=Musa troglodytarum TaxID=320322 RepID=A0A9E7GM60_9LILI|nr:hypothetical protein MUK42_05226 [Musa troglodytarum]
MKTQRLSFLLNTDDACEGVAKGSLMCHRYSQLCLIGLKMGGHPSTVTPPLFFMPRYAFTLYPPNGSNRSSQDQRRRNHTSIDLID